MWIKMVPFQLMSCQKVYFNFICLNLKVMKCLGLIPNPKELSEIIKQIDPNQNGRIEFEEFVELMQALNKGETPEDEMKEAFKAFDRNGDGFIVEADLVLAFKLIGLKLTETQIHDLIAEAGL
jgi:calmodulin